MCDGMPPGYYLLFLACLLNRVVFAARAARLTDYCLFLWQCNEKEVEAAYLILFIPVFFVYDVGLYALGAGRLFNSLGGTYYLCAELRMV